MLISALDIGGSAVKAAEFDVAEAPMARPVLLSPVTRYPDPDWERFEEWLAQRWHPRGRQLAVSCAGFVSPSTGRVRSFRWRGWDDRDVRELLQARFSLPSALVLNDAEAHLAAHLAEQDGPVLCAALGSAVGIAVSTEDGQILRPRRDRCFDFGEVLLRTRASNPRLWWALGAEGLKELEAGPGVDHYCCRLGAALASLASIFQPRTIVLSGGITASLGGSMLEPVRAQFERTKPFWLEMPRLVLSEHGGNAALWGVATYLAAQAVIRPEP